MQPSGGPDANRSRPASNSPLLQQVRELTRALHLSIRTEEAYVRWIEQFLRYHRDLAGHWRHPTELGSAEVNQFLTHLAIRRHVAASTQNQALSAILFLYRKVLRTQVTFDAVRAKRPERIPSSSASRKFAAC